MKMPKLIVVIAGAALVISSAAVAETSGMMLKPIDLKTWPRMRATDFGCMLEKNYSIHDPRFNCASTFEKIDWGDTCTDPGPYYAGPELPHGVAAAIDPSIRDVGIEWEGGRMIDVTVQFDRKVSAADVQSMFGLQMGGALPANIMSATLDDGHLQGGSSLSLRGFEHMGAGDVECDTPPASAQVPRGSIRRMRGR